LSSSYSPGGAAVVHVPSRLRGPGVLVRILKKEKETTTEAAAATDGKIWPDSVIKIPKTHQHQQQFGDVASSTNDRTSNASTPKDYSTRTSSSDDAVARTTTGSTSNKTTTTTTSARTPKRGDICLVSALSYHYCVSGSCVFSFCIA